MISQTAREVETPVAAAGAAAPCANAGAAMKSRVVESRTRFTKNSGGGGPEKCTGARRFAPATPSSKRARASGRGHISAEDRNHLTGDEARIGVGGEKDVNRRKLLRLTRPSHRRGSAELRNVFRILRRGVQRSPDRTC